MKYEVKMCNMKLYFRTLKEESCNCTTNHTVNARDYTK